MSAPRRTVALPPLLRLSGGALALSAATALLNALWFRRPTGMLPTPAPRVSILVPARNEAPNIAACVRSLLAQDYPADRVEVLVLDDGSTDGTGEMLDALAREHPQALRILHGGEALPAGWYGKPWACQRLLDAAHPEADFVLLTDADTVHSPTALRQSVAAAVRARLDLLSLMPRQEMGTWTEQAVVSLLPLQILGYLPLPLAEWSTHPALAAANGQFMLFRAPFLRQRLGGYQATRASGADDMVLARAAKGVGGRVRLANGVDLVRCRMYRTPADLWRGFTKSFTGGFRLGPAIALLMIAWNLLAYFLPLLALGFGMLRHAPWRHRAVGQVLGMAAVRLLLGWRSGMAPSAILWHPLGMALLLGIQCRAALNVIGRRQLQWKGRHYATTE